MYVLITKLEYVYMQIAYTVVATASAGTLPI
jgi:hypothetical protein